MSNSEQILTKLTSRRLLTFEKIRNLNPSDANLQTQIVDFREKYYEAREETRKEKRMREARIRKENWRKSQN